MKLRKSLVKQKTCNYIELFGSSVRDRHARPPIYASRMTISGRRTEQHVITGFRELAAVD